MMVLIILGTAIAILTLPGTIELLVLTIGGTLSPRRRARKAVAETFNLAVVVPAHNEESNIARTVKSLQSAGPLTVVVVADNCDDRTADVAREAGARVLVRNNRDERGKGYALNFAFETLLPENHDAFAVVDADSVVAPNFAVEIESLLRSGADAVQCRYLVRNAGESIRTRLMNVALSAFNVLRPRGRDRWGLSCGIYGNGFALSAETLRSVPYTAASVVEDLEYHIALVRAGRRVEFADATTVFGDMPSSGAGVKTQRARWEGGRFRMIAEKVPQLAKETMRGRLAFLEPCLDLLLLPLAFHVTLLLLAAATPFWPARAAGLAGLTVVLFHLLAAIRVTGGGASELAALAAAPFYVIWKILLLPRLIKSSRSNAAWVRTERQTP